MEAEKQEILKRFVLRARRIESHSLVKNWDELVYHARGVWKISINDSGNSTLVRRLPESEEVFESLAARVRPLMLQSESIYYTKVINAVTVLLGEDRKSNPYWNALQELRKKWMEAEVRGNKIKGYGVQMSSVDGSIKTKMISDTALANAWLYTDLVHSDLDGGESESLLFSLEDRYQAGVHLFSLVAVLAVKTLALVKVLHDSGYILIPESAWTEGVVIESSEIIETGKAYFAPVGTDVPDIDQPLSFADDWSQVTTPSMAKMNSENHVRVFMEKESGDSKTKEAVILRRSLEGDEVFWEVLVADGSVFKFTFDLDDEVVVGVKSAQWKGYDASTETRLAWFRLLLELNGTSRIVFETQGVRFASVHVPSFSDSEVQRHKICEQVYLDLLEIERIKGISFAAPNQAMNNSQRVQLRQARLLWQGHIVNYTNRPLVVVKEDGESPALIEIPEGVLCIGGVEIPIPRIYVCHPEMTVSDQGDAPDVGPEAKKYLILSPDDEMLLAWAPDIMQVSTSEDLVPTTTWDLPGIS